MCAGAMPEPLPPSDRDPSIRLRIVFGADAMLGPGKADLLRHIAATGSIAAAGRRMAMSYKRAWGLVAELNAAFDPPLVVSVRGGATGGGARLTPAGAEVLQLYRALEALMADQGGAEIARLHEMLADMSGRK